MRARLPGHPLVSLVPAFLAALAWVTTAGAAPAALEVALSESAAQRAAGVSNAIPILAAIGNMTVNPGATADQTITATDADGNSLTFGKSFGPAFVTVSTTSPGTGSAEGLIHAAPAASDVGTNQVGVTVTDGLAMVAQSMVVVVPAGNRAPVLTQPSDMTVAAGGSVAQEITASDVDGNPLSFYLVSGPAFATVSTSDPGAGFGTGIVRLATLITQATGTFPVAVGVSDGTLSDQKSFTATVMPRINTAPVLIQPPQVIEVNAGFVVDLGIRAADAEHDQLTFALVTGPSFVTVTTVDPAAGTGNVHIAPSVVVNTNYYPVTVSVTDGLATDQKSFQVFVRGSHPPVISFVGNMSLRAGQTGTQTVYASDQDGDFLTFGKAAGPSYMAVTTAFQGNGYGYGTITLTPGVGDIGSASGTVSVTDGVLSDQKSFAITVNPPNNPPVVDAPANMTVTQGSFAEQTVHATDPDGDYVDFMAGPGPAYVSVFTSDTNTGTIQLTPGPADVGTAQGTVRASDAYNGVTDVTFQITVLAGDFPPPCPDGSFTSTSPPATSPLGVTVADLNGDDVPDVLAATYVGGNTDVYLGNGDGSLAAPVHYASLQPVDVAIGDFNGDFIPDLATADWNPTSVGIRLGLGPGTFGPLQSVLVSGAPRHILTADFDRDGRLDLVTGNSNQTNTVSILYGNGAGGFGQPRYLTLNAYAYDIQVVDMNQDGWPDIVVTLSSGQVAFLNNLHNGTFSITTLTPPGFSGSARLADMNGDGTLDLVTGDFNGFVHILPGTGPGTFGPAATFSAPYLVNTAMTIADFNGDSMLDVAVASDTVVGILLGDGNGALGSRMDIPSQGLRSLAAADLDNDLRTDLVGGVYFSPSSLTVLLNHGCAPQRDRPPHVLAPRTATVAENAVLTLNVTATDPDGDPIALLRADVSDLPLGANAAFATSGANTAGIFTWTPTSVDSRSAPYRVRFIASNALRDTATTYIAVTNVNRAPVADPGGPYTALVDVALQFQGTASSDPDGDPLLYSWVFGDGTSGKGPAPMHTYHTTGTYAVGLVVSDGTLAAVGTTTASVLGVFPARAFTVSGNKTIRLNAGKPRWCVEIEPSNASFLLQVVDLASIRMKSVGTGSVSEIPAIADKSSLGSDRDGNGIAEFEACFAKTDLRLLFSNLHGTTAVTVAIQGSLLTGGLFQATMDVAVQAGGGGNLSTTLSPNPLNPTGVLTLRLERAGPLRVAIYDVSGRLVRVLCDEPSAAAGYHDFTVAARGSRGEALPSGVYFYRVEAAEGVDGGRFTVLK